MPGQLIGGPERTSHRARGWRPFATLAAVLALAGCGGSGAASSSRLLAENPNLDPGSQLANRMAPNFTLTDEQGGKVSLRSYRGKVVLLAFNDSQCTTVCPLTTQAMLDAKRALGTAGRNVVLLGVDANPKAIRVHDVLSYTELHGLLGRWHFLTGSLRALKRVWRAYGIGVEVQRGQIDHTPALFVIGRQGRMSKVFLTRQSYAAVPQLGQLLAGDAAALLPDHPRVSANLSYATISGISPTRSISLPRSGGGSLRLGPGGGPRLLVFFATWDRQVMNLAGNLSQLSRYSAAAQTGHLPALTAVDEASVEPSSTALPRFLSGVGPLRFPVVLDRTGRVADGYEVQDEPWFVLVSATGRILWYRDASTAGWPSLATLETEVRAGLAKVPGTANSAASAQKALTGSPAPLDALHKQASQLLSGRLLTRVQGLRGYPVVVNIWASWCIPCQQEFGLLRTASIRYGKRVAFLGADYHDQAGNARAFLSGHLVAYPSYSIGLGGVPSLLPGGIPATPTTFFINRQGQLAHVNIGSYASQGTLDQDIQSYALSG